MKDYDVDTNKPHGSSSGYHSEEYSPTRVTSNISLQMPGMMTDPHSPHHITNTINPSDVIVVSELSIKVEIVIIILYLLVYLKSRSIFEG